ncbi:3001_t:CDS:2, partial [Dentiscutata erythropus]
LYKSNMARTDTALFENEQVTFDSFLENDDDYILANSESTSLASALSVLALLASASVASASATSASLASALLEVYLLESSMLPTDASFDNELDISTDLSNSLELI